MDTDAEEDKEVSVVPLLFIEKAKKIQQHKNISLYIINKRCSKLSETENRAVNDVNAGWGDKVKTGDPTNLLWCKCRQNTYIKITVVSVLLNNLYKLFGKKM